MKNKTIHKVDINFQNVILFRVTNCVHKTSLSLMQELQKSKKDCFKRSAAVSGDLICTTTVSLSCQHSGCQFKSRTCVRLQSELTEMNIQQCCKRR